MDKDTLGGVPRGPLVLPGVYSVTIATPVRQLKGELRVEGDPRVTFSDVDRRARQTALLTLYDLQKTLAATRSATGTGTRFAQIRTDITTALNVVNNLSRAIEGCSGLPTTDQQRQLDWAFEDVSRAVDALNRLLQTDTPGPARLIAVPARRQ
jgi:hypothetical protein